MGGNKTGEDSCDVKREDEYPVASSKITSELSVTVLVSGFQKRQPLLVALYPMKIIGVPFDWNLVRRDLSMNMYANVPKVL